MIWVSWTYRPIVSLYTTFSRLPLGKIAKHTVKYTAGSTAMAWRWTKPDSIGEATRRQHMPPSFFSFESCCYSPFATSPLLKPT